MLKRGAICQGCDGECRHDACVRSTLPCSTRQARQSPPSAWTACEWASYGMAHAVRLHPITLSEQSSRSLTSEQARVGNAPG
jgi:hypothetical protein